MRKSILVEPTLTLFFLNKSEKFYYVENDVNSIMFESPSFSSEMNGERIRDLLLVLISLCAGFLSETALR